MPEILKKLTDKKPLILFIMGLSGILLIFLSSLLPEKETAADPAEDPTAVIETRLEELIGRIEGAGETKVLITLRDGGSTEYLRSKELTEAYDGGQLTVREENGEYILSGGSAVVVAHKTPSVMGAAVVCEGGDKASVQKDIYDVLYALYGLSSARVSIEKMS